MKKQRSKYEITAAILECYKNVPALQTHVSLHCNLSNEHAVKMLNILIDANMITALKRGKDRYLTTERGRLWLEKYYALVGPPIGDNMPEIICRSCGRKTKIFECEVGLSIQCSICRRIANADPLIP